MPFLHSPSRIINPLAHERRFGFGSGMGGGSGASFTGELDAYAASFTAVAGPRRWLSSYTGPCLRARRNSAGNPELDFNFLANGDVDLSAIDDWAGTNSVFLKGFYDQKTGALIEQATAASQLRLVNAGTLDLTPGGKLKPCAPSDNIGGYCLGISIYTGSTVTVIASHILANAAPAFGRMVGLTSGAGNDFTATSAVAMLLRNNVSQSVCGYRNLTPVGAGDAITYGAPFSASARLTGSQHVLTTDGTAVSAASSGSLNVNKLLWGGSSISAPYMHTGDALLSMVLATADLGATDTEAIRQILAAYHT